MVGKPPESKFEAVWNLWSLVIEIYSMPVLMHDFKTPPCPLHLSNNKQSYQNAILFSLNYL